MCFSFIFLTFCCLCQMPPQTGLYAGYFRPIKSILTPQNDSHMIIWDTSGWSWDEAKDAMTGVKVK